MRFKRLVFLPSILIFSILLLCCDKYEFGYLTEAETNDLYVEMKEDLEKGEIWDLETAYFYQNDNEVEDGLLFLKEAARAVFEYEAFTSMVGTWRAGKGTWCVSKNKAKLLYITCQTPFCYELNDYIIDSLSIEKYSISEHFSISIHYHKTDAESKSFCITIITQDVSRGRFS